MEHFSSFSSLWKGGYFERDPLDSVGPSKYRGIGYISILHAVYLVCIKPYVNSESIVLEIAPGRGAWTKTMLDAQEVWCLDAKSREDNGIDEYLRYPQNLLYHQVKDFSCSMLPDDTFTYMFSFGCFCHVPRDGVQQYAAHLFSKLKSGAHAFWMVADYDKRNTLSASFTKYDIIKRTLPPRVFHFIERINSCYRGRLIGPAAESPIDKDGYQTADTPGCWYNGGSEYIADMLRKVGYTVISSDIGLSPRDALLHFQKP